MITILLWQTLLAASVSAASCLVTLAPSPPFVPPEPYNLSPDRGFWFGSRRLWIRLPIELSTRHLEKLFVWSEDYKDPRRESKPALVVTGRRLDGDSQPFIVQDATNVTSLVGGPAMLTSITIPEIGCWELTAFYRNATLSFIVSVEH